MLISAHLSSKPERYEVQAEEMFKALEEIKEENHDLDIILGTDCNHFMSPKKYTSFNISPSMEVQSTTIKKRTAIQVQSRKTNVIVMETKDQIVTNLDILESHVGMISGKGISDKTYLPC